MPATVDDGDEQDRAKLAKEGVGQDRAHKRQEVTEKGEIMEALVGLVLRHQIEGAGAVAQVLRHEHREDGGHAVVAEALGRLGRDDERDALGHLVRFDRRGEECCFP